MKIDTYQSSKELLDIIDENFYTTFSNAEAYFDYLNKLIEALSIEHNIKKPPKISFFVDSPLNIASCERKKIKTNKALYEMFDKCRKDNNFYYVFSTLDAIVHEFRHYFQHCAKNGDISEFIKTSSKVLYKISSTYCDLKISYNNSPIEIDARYFAYTHLKDHKFLSTFYSSNQFILTEQRRHLKQPFSVLMLIDYISPVILPWNKKEINKWEEEFSILLSQNNIDYKELREKYNNFKNKRNEIETTENETIYKNTAPNFTNLKLHKQNSKEKKIEESCNQYSFHLFHTCYDICKRERPDLIIHEDKTEIKQEQ